MKVIITFTSSYYLKMLEERIPEDFDGSPNYILSADEVVLVKIGELYNSNELKKDIPKSLRTFRYKP